LTDSLVSAARKLTRGLVDFLVDVTEASERDPQLDILATPKTWDRWLVQWVDELPAEAGTPNVRSQDVLFRMKPPVAKLVPTPPDEVLPWLDSSQPWDTYTNEPKLSEPPTPAAAGDGQDAPQDPETTPVIPANVATRFEQWLGDWRAWAVEREVVDRLQPVYNFLENAAKEIQQRDDQFELVLARGLVRWVTPEGKLLRRHLITEQLLPALDRKTAEVTISRIGAPRRYEDSQLFGEVESYRHDRGHEARGVLDQALGEETSADHYVQLLGEWVGRCLSTTVQAAAAGAHVRDPGELMEISAAPALILRPRSKVLLAEAYKRIARELQDPETPLPVALAQLVIDTEAEQRQQWITLQQAATGDFLGDDPRFPLDANPEQERVMHLLRTETGVVVQGPPGTGKTHTIANLVSALLARGQRVLVTSQKDQALRVLRDKIP
jgi:AAA domain